MGNWALTAGVFVESETMVTPPSPENYDTESELEAAVANYEELIGTLKEGDAGTKTTIKTTIPGMIGSSGSPIFNLKGEVIALLWGAIGIQPLLETDDVGLFKEPMPHVMHSVPVIVSREWTSGSPAWKVQELIAKWLQTD